ncbi:MAG TPA: PIG-L family deacetylase [Thermoanaerobaculaceae bacterium]|nr:PIG-L family deacetylase [Thermoanaerobaculaceae bacterium]
MTIPRQCLASLASLAALLCTSGATAQPPAVDAARRRVAVERLAVVGSALYIGAHPDDENTAMLAWLAQGRKVRTAYLALTRGDGGQNLIGTEQGDQLGVVRTEELLAARAIDGAEQFFTRAIDFGFSKGPEETLRFWGHDAVLSDVVWVIRSFRPDVIVTRFPANGEGGHGHHTASAILAAEAFTAAADPTRFPEQLRFVSPWQAKRLMWNAWRRDGEPRPADAKPQLTVDLGAYDPVLGASFAEIAAASRSMHKSQGFGSAPRRGSLPNYLEMVAGDPATKDLFDGVDLTWGQVPGGTTVGRIIAQTIAEYRDTDPAASVPALLEALAALGRLEQTPWVSEKRQEVLEVVRMCTGLWLEAMSSRPTATPGSAVDVTALAVNRSAVPISLVRLETPFPSAPAAAAGGHGDLPVSLADNEPVTRTMTVQLPKEIAYTQPYWLASPHGLGLYNVSDQTLIGQPRTPPAVTATFVLHAGGEELRYSVPVQHRWTDPVEGERTRELAIVPRVTVDLGVPVIVLPDGRPRQVRVTARAHEAKTSATVRLAATEGWRVEPESATFAFETPGDEGTARFTLSPPPRESTGELTAFVRTDREEQARTEVEISHPHIPPQMLLPPAAARLVRVDVTRTVTTVGYVMGPGEETPAVLRQLGFDVELLTDDQLEDADLSRFGTIVVGVRAYNTRPRLSHAQERLLAYVQGGGTLVVQYNTERGLVTENLGPFPLKLSRERVTDETAPVTILMPQHPMLTTPLAISARDFDGWIQERGLYFPGTWDPRYQALLSMSDPGEKPLQGGLLFAAYGKGTYVHTSLAFFRELPAGVRGAIRLFVDLLAGGRPHA